MSNDALTSGDDEDGLFEFAMGEHIVKFPGQCRYTTNHMWAVQTGPNRWRFGLTAYAVRLLQDVYFLDWIIDPGSNVASRDPLGSIESKKAESDLFAPVAGVLTVFNSNVLDDPSLINSETYGDGWLFEIGSSQTSELLTPKAYANHLIEAWKVAQRTIKGQANI